jgi:hypothetical protein
VRARLPSGLGPLLLPPFLLTAAAACPAAPSGDDDATSPPAADDDDDDDDDMSPGEVDYVSDGTLLEAIGSTPWPGPSGEAVQLGEPETIRDDLSQPLHIAAMPDGQIVIAEPAPPPYEFGRLRVLRPGGELLLLMDDIPAVLFGQEPEVHYLGAQGMSPWREPGELLLASFLGDSHGAEPVGDGPLPEPGTGTILFRVPIPPIGEAPPPGSYWDLQAWTNIEESMIYDIAWSPAGVLMGSASGINLAQIVGDRPGDDPADGRIPMPRIPIEPVDNFDDVQSVPTGVALHGGRVFVAEFGGVPGGFEDPAPIGPEELALDVGRLSQLFPDGQTAVVADGFDHALDVVALPQGNLVVSVDDFAGPGLGSILEIEAGGGNRVLADGLTMPTSLAFDGTWLWVATMPGLLLRYEVLSP